VTTKFKEKVFQYLHPLRHNALVCGTDGGQIL